MALKDAKQGLSGQGKVAPKSTSTDKTIFGGKKEIPMRDAAWKIKKDPGTIPGTGGQMFSRQEMSRLADKISKKYGSQLGQNERSKIFRDFRAEKGRAKGADKLNIERQIRFLEKKIGK